MRAKVFFIIQRKKDGLYYMETNDDGLRTFVSSMKLAHKFNKRQEAMDQMKAIKNWLGRPKLKLLTGQHISR